MHHCNHLWRCSSGQNNCYHVFVVTILRLVSSDCLFFFINSLTCGITWHSVGLVGLMRKHKLLTEMCLRSAHLYQTLPMEVGISTGRSWICWFNMGTSLYWQVIQKCAYIPISTILLFWCAVSISCVVSFHLIRLVHWHTMWMRVRQRHLQCKYA